MTKYTFSCDEFALCFAHILFYQYEPTQIINVSSHSNGDSNIKLDSYIICHSLIDMRALQENTSLQSGKSAGYVWFVCGPEGNDS